MNGKAIIILTILYFIILYLNKLFFKKEHNYYNSIIVIVALCLDIGIKVGNSQALFSDEVDNIYVPLAIFVIAMIAIVNIKVNLKKVKFDELIVIIILISIALSYTNGQINDINKFFSIAELYASILLIGFMYKNLEDYNIESILDTFSYMAIFNGILGLLQFITNKKLIIGAFNDTIDYTQGLGTVKRVVGIAGTNNSGGNLGAILFCIVLFNYLRTKKKMHLFAVIMNGMFLALTLTRIGYLAAIIEAGIFFLFSKWESNSAIIKKMSLVFIGIGSMLLMALIFSGKILNTLFIERGNTEMSRIIQYNNVFQNIIFTDSFWNGIGIGQYKYYCYYKIGIPDIDIHSQYINVLAEQGIFIFILFVILNIYILRKALANVEYKLEKAFIISLFVGNLICCNFNPNQYYLINNLLYYLLMYCYVYKQTKK